MQALYLHLWWSLPTATCAGGVFHRSTSAFTNVHAYCNLHCVVVVVVIVFLCCGGGCICGVVAVHGVLLLLHTEDPS